MNKLVPGQGFAEVLAGARGVGATVEAYARGELGVKFAPNGSAFAFGEATIAPGLAPAWQAGIGARVAW